MYAKIRMRESPATIGGDRKGRFDNRPFHSN